MVWFHTTSFASYSSGLSLAEGCRLMGLPRFTFYDAPAIPADDDVIVARITVICDDFEAYGYRQVGAELRHQGVVVNSKKLRRLMRENDLQPKGDAYRAITSVISWERFCATVAEAKALARGHSCRDACR